MTTIRSKAPGSNTWHKYQRYTHHVLVLLVPMMILLGYLSQRDGVEQGANLWLLPTHQILGLAVLLLASYRIFLRLSFKRPKFPGDMPQWQIGAVRLVHGLLYLLPVLLPVLGILLSWIDPFLSAELPNHEPDYSYSDALAQQLVAVQNRQENMMLSDSAVYWLDVLHLSHYYAAWLLLFCLVIHVCAAVFHKVKSSKVNLSQEQGSLGRAGS